MSNQKMREALQGFLNVVNESQGVAGYHLNGDIAEWGEFPEVDLAVKALAQPADVVTQKPLPFWPACNPACDVELNGFRDSKCDCANAREALAQPADVGLTDAERYRWLREKVAIGRLTVSSVGAFDLMPWSGDDLDGAIDAAHEAKKAGGGA